MEQLIVETQFQDDGKPPRSKMLIAIYNWSGSLNYSQTELYYISGSSNRREWRFWVRSCEGDMPDFWLNAVRLQSDNQLSRKDAAIRVFLEYWRAIWKGYGVLGTNFSIDQEGILDRDTLRLVAAEAFVS